MPAKQFDYVSMGFYTFDALCWPYTETPAGVARPSWMISPWQCPVPPEPPLWPRPRWA